MTDMFLLVQGNWLDRIYVKFQITEAIVHRSGRNLNKRKICHLQNMCPASCVTESSQNYEVLPHEHWEPVEGARRLWWALKRNWYVCAKEGVFIPLQCAGSVPVVIRQSPENICNLADFLSLQDKMQDRSCFLSLEAPCRANDCGVCGVQPDGFWQVNLSLRYKICVSPRRHLLCKHSSTKTGKLA